jgi:protein-S-isoprenylcysteine O-methyltransferase Ste14
MFIIAAATVLHLTVPVALTPPQWPGAVVLCVAGFAIMLRAWWLFRAVENPICPTARATILITHDVYAFSRNPMYLGMLMMLLAIALFAGTAAFYAAVIAYFLILNFVFCPFEEDRLRATFAGYGSYESRVRRWV